ncbi:hypothetical protein F5Y04DRAFT_280742 [Hypomontagnella monticulosa]|nr:hypothetical protein F5Y04DRAFT_280742 [Hypomontagnella monticulosa]
MRRRRLAQRRIAQEAGRLRAAAVRPLRLCLPPGSTPELPRTGLGKLRGLPDEVILIMLSKCTLRTLLRLERVNKAINGFIKCLFDYAHVKDTAKGIVRRATAHYRKFMFTIIKITTYQGLRHLLATYTCEKCGNPGSFRMVKAKRPPGSDTNGETEN